jgi:hypothetical protein
MTPHETTTAKARAYACLHFPKHQHPQTITRQPRDLTPAERLRWKSNPYILKLLKKTHLL